MKSIFENPKLKSQQSRNPFDRGAKNVFHAPFGMILPCFFARVSPDDYIELSAENQTICEPLARPAFMRLKEHIDYYFVPFSQLFTPFENLVTAQDNYFSDAIGDVQLYNTPNSVPLFNGDFLFKQLRYMSDQVDQHGFNEMFGSLRLLDLLGYGNYYSFVDDFFSGESSQMVNSSHIPAMNFFNLLAYQKIYYDYYRNPKYEKNIPQAYNLDRQPADYIFTNNEAGSSFKEIFEVHYRWQKKDYFMSVQPSIIPSSQNIGYKGITEQYFTSGVNFVVPGITPSSAGLQSGAVAYIGNDGENIDTATNSASTTNTNLYRNINSVAAIRLNFALDKIARRQREAGAQFDKQMLAQFGITPIDERHGKCVFIGGQTNRLYASDVTNQSETGQSGLGSLGGQINVYSPNRRIFKYHAKEHGIVMGIYSTSLDNDYASFFISRDNTAQGRCDWSKPALDKLGLQPVFRHELTILDDNSSTQQYEELDPSIIAPVAHQRDILGFVRRYLEYKTNIDSVHGLFASKTLSAEDAAWVTKWNMSQYAAQARKQLVPLTIQTMTFNPQTFDDVSKVDYTGEWNSDHFKINHYTHCRVISNMDRIGEDF